MANSKKTNSKSKTDTQKERSNCCEGNFEEMFRKMKEFWGANEKSFDCCEMMQQMSGNMTDKPKK
jgi:hypothetical protein